MPMWDLKCLICGATGTDLVALQEHAMREHGYTQNDHRLAQSKGGGDVWVWTFPDGVQWMRAVKRAEPFDALHLEAGDRVGVTVDARPATPPVFKVGDRVRVESVTHRGESAEGEIALASRDSRSLAIAFMVDGIPSMLGFDRMTPGAPGIAMSVQGIMLLLYQNDVVWEDTALVTPRPENVWAGVNYRDWFTVTTLEQKDNNGRTLQPPALT